MAHQKYRLERTVLVSHSEAIFVRFDSKRIVHAQHVCDTIVKITDAVEVQLQAWAHQKTPLRCSIHLDGAGQCH